MNNLAEEFNVEEIRKEIKSFKDIIKDIKEIQNPSHIVTAAIEKASIFVDLIHSECVNGELSPRYAEVISQLLSTIIQSSNFLTEETQREFDNRIKLISVNQKDKEIGIKDREVSIKELYYNTKNISNKNNTNVIVTDIDSIMNFLESKDPNQIIEKKD